MGRTPSHHQQGFGFEEIHHTPAAAGDTPPPPLLEEDLYEPVGYKTPASSNKKQPQPQPSPLPQVHAFPPPQSFPPADDVEPQSFPPRQEQTPPQRYPPEQDINIPPQNLPQQNILNQQQIAMAVAATQQNLIQDPKWKTHICGCMENPQNAIITLFCPCVTFGQIAEVLDNGSTSCATNAIWYTLIAICIGMPCLMSCGYRSKLRAKFGLVESPAPDCLVHCFCDYCALCQEYRELYARDLDPSIVVGVAGSMNMEAMEAGTQSGDSSLDAGSLNQMMQLKLRAEFGKNTENVGGEVNEAFDVRVSAGVDGHRSHSHSPSLIPIHHFPSGNF